MYKSITLSGPVASGTTTAGKTLAKKYNLEYHSAGDFFRKYFKDQGIPLPDKDKVPDELDRKIDEEMTSLLASDKPVIVDGLYYGYFTREMPHVLKVLITANQDVRIKRAEQRISSFPEDAEAVKKRDRLHDVKFRKLYADENFLDPKFFDLVIDTTNTTQEEVIDKISEAFEKS